MNKISPYWLIAAFIIGVVAFYIYMNYFYVPDETVVVNPRREYDIVTLTLPNSVNPDVFGPKYWQAFHHLAKRLPCVHCRNKAEPFMNFFHDVVNKETDKPIFDKENFNKHIDMISKLPKA